MSDDERWTLTVEFDSPKTQSDDPYFEGDTDEATAFVDRMHELWALEPDEVDELVKRDGDVVTVQADLLDYLINPIQMVILGSIPRKITVTRNEERCG